MSIEIKISKKPVEYIKALSFLEKRMLELKDKKQSELIWILEHPSTYTKGIRSKAVSYTHLTLPTIYSV